MLVQNMGKIFYLKNIDIKSTEHSQKINELKNERKLMQTIEVKMVLKKNNEEKNVFFFTNINGPFLTDDDVIDAITEKIENMALKYSDWAKCGYATALHQGNELFTMSFMDDGSLRKSSSMWMGEMENTTRH